MLCLTIRQPWASLILHDLKTEEYRSWTTSYRGKLAIHAGGTLAADPDDLMVVAALVERGTYGWYRPALANVARWLSRLPRGVILGTVYLVGVHQLIPEHPSRRWGRFAWQLSGPVALAEPVGATGQLRLWHLPPAVAALLAA
jgi:hypothetical protein